MTHKTNPISNRLNITKEWKSRWFNLKDYQKYAQEDYVIRQYIYDKFRNAGIARVDVEREANSVSVIIHTSRPGILIGRGGTGIEELKRNIQKLLRRKIKVAPYVSENSKEIPEVRVEVREVREVESDARLVASNIAEQLERRLPFRRVIKRALDRVSSNKDIKGAKINVKGRLNGAEMARTEFIKTGNLPLQTLRGDIDYAYVEAVTKYGVIGVKVWLYKGEKLE